MVLLSVYGGHRYMLLFHYLRGRKRPMPPARTYEASELPGITVQLPLYNEMYVIDRLLSSVAELEYPRDRFEIQVLDDSTDETVDIVRRRVHELKASGLNIVHIHRTDRTGYKAGALANGLKSASHDLIAIFDADFRPEPNFLLQLVHYFTDPKVGAAQSRWGHLNEEQSTLTKVQALMLNGHFLLEHTGRTRCGLFMNFNGTGGIWRRQAIEDAGGWQHDTITEDLDLSYRAQMKGWRIAYDPGIVCPAELPVEMNAYKSQQHRWAKGSIQTMFKVLPALLKSTQPLGIKLEGFMHLTSNLAYLVMVPMCLLSLPMLILRARIVNGNVGVLVDIGILLCATASMLVFYTVTQMVGYQQWWKRWGLVPMLMALGVGMTVNQAKAVFEAVIGNQSAFVRTPKFNLDQGSKGNAWAAMRYRGVRGWAPWVELFFALYFTISAGYCISHSLWMTLPFVMIFFTGFWYVCILSLFQGRRASAGARAPVTVPA
ncbi:MAG TPA: glycosyltransferase [Planctomycetota bacterium]|nr:glycosyltransferase [Planctomycetota bacterium]